MVTAVQTKSPLLQMRGYLEQRGFPVDPSINSYEDSLIRFGGANECREAIGIKAAKDDTRTGIIFQFPGVDYAQVRWFGTYHGPLGKIKAQNPPRKESLAYLTPVCDWDNYPPNTTLYICESPLKALVLAWRGYYAIASTGVWNLVPKNTFVENFPHHLKDHTGKVAILFDNDYKRNPNVRGAIRRLGNMVKEAWQVPVVNIPLVDPPVGSPFQDVSRGQKDMGKWGIDDAIATLGDDWLHEWLADPTTPEPVAPTEMQAMCDELSAEFAVCQQPACVLKQDTGAMYSRANFVGIIAADKMCYVENKTNDGGKYIKVAEQWMASPERTVVDRLVYRPGAAERVDRDARVYNLWRDDGLPPVEGDIEPFLRVYRNAVPDNPTLELLLDSLAWIMQNRGKRLEKTFVLVGAKVGTGKSMLGKIMSKCVGRANYAVIGEDDFQRDFNSFIANKEFVMMDDVDKLSKGGAAKLRRSVTEDYILVNTKGIPEYEVENYATFIITSNHYDALEIKGIERRNLVVHFEPSVYYPQGDQWWLDFAHWLEDEQGYSIIRHWLESRDLTGFNANYMPPLNEIKELMVSQGMSELDEFIFTLQEDLPEVLGNSKRSWFLSQELEILRTGSADQRDWELTSMGKKMGAAGFHQMKSQVSTGNGWRGRPWQLQGFDKEWSISQIRNDIRQVPIALGGNKY
jgi:hypothetical protein